MKIDTLTQKDIDNFKRLNINKTLIEEFEENKQTLKNLEETSSLKQEFSKNKIIDNIEIGKECIKKGLILTPLDECNFIIPIKVVNMVVEFAKQF